MCKAFKIVVLTASQIFLYFLQICIVSKRSKACNFCDDLKIDPHVIMSGTEAADGKLWSIVSQDKRQRAYTKRQYPAALDWHPRGENEWVDQASGR